jgi:hypothetical protein
MQTSIFIGLLLSSGVASAGLGNLLRLAEFIADIYQQFSHSCIFIIDSEAQKGEGILFTAIVCFCWTEMYLQNCGEAALLSCIM